MAGRIARGQSSPNAPRQARLSPASAIPGMPARSARSRPPSRYRCPIAIDGHRKPSFSALSAAAKPESPAPMTMTCSSRLPIRTPSGFRQPGHGLRASKQPMQHGTISANMLPVRRYAVRSGCWRPSPSARAPQGLTHTWQSDPNAIHWLRCGTDCRQYGRNIRGSDARHECAHPAVLC